MAPVAGAAADVAARLSSSPSRHTTAHASEILRDGFRDGTDNYGFVDWSPIGVFLSIRPATEPDGAPGTDVLAVTFPHDVDMDDYAMLEEGRGEIWEWVVPASVLNTVATIRLLSEAEVDELCG